ncbi:MAG: hypothetical protein M3Y87_12345 [Myxococcota bacterium]|nr:hypothetical protein [Myxococcota bacterium]
MRWLDPHGAAAYRFFLQAAVAVALVLGAVLALEAQIAQSPEGWTEWIPELPAEGMSALRRSTGTVVMLGDSVVAARAETDQDRRTLSRMIDEELEQESLTVLLRGATTIALHAAQLRFLARHRHTPPRAAIVPLNPRAFGRTWDHEPSWQFAREAALYDHPILARGAAVLGWTWGAPTAEACASVRVTCGDRDLGAMRDLQQWNEGWDVGPELGRTRYLARYAGDVRRSVRMSDLARLIATAEAMPFPVLIYVTPVDVGAAGTLLDASELACVDDNLEHIARALARYRGPHLDLSRAVGPESFDHPPNDPHEHLDEDGRLLVARAVASAVAAAIAR